MNLKVTSTWGFSVIGITDEDVGREHRRGFHECAMQTETASATRSKLSRDWLLAIVVLTVAILAIVVPYLWVKPVTGKAAHPVVCTGGGACIDE